MGAPAPAKSGVDGPGWAGGELRSDASGGGRFAGRAQHVLAADQSADRAPGPGDRGAVRILLAEPVAGHVQFASGAPARWQRGNHAVYERKPGTAVLGLAARQQLCNGGSAGGPAGVPLLLWSRREFRHQPPVAQSLLKIQVWFSCAQFGWGVPSSHTFNSRKPNKHISFLRLRSLTWHCV